MKKTALFILSVLALCVVMAFPATAEDTSPRNEAREHLSGMRSRKAESTPAPTAEPEPEISDDPLLNIAMNMIVNIHTLAGDDQYFEMYGLSEPEYSPIIAETDPRDLRAIYQITLPDGLMKIVMGIGFDLSDAARERATGTMAVSISNLWNGSRGNQALAEQSCLQWSRPYLAPENFEPCTWLMDCGGALYWASFVQSNEGIMTVDVSPMFLNEGEDINTALEYLHSINDEVLPMIGIAQIWPESE